MKICKRFSRGLALDKTKLNSFLFEIMFTLKQTNAIHRLSMIRIYFRVRWLEDQESGVVSWLGNECLQRLLERAHAKSTRGPIA